MSKECQKISNRLILCQDSNSQEFPQKKDRLDGATSRRSEKGEKELKSQEGRAFIITFTLPFLLTVIL